MHVQHSHLTADDIIQGQIIYNITFLLFVSKTSTAKHTDSKHCNKETVVPTWSGNFFSCKVSPGTAAPHLSVTPEGSDGDFGNSRTSSCASPALPQRLFYTALMPWLSTTSTASPLRTAEPFLGDKKRKKAQYYQGVAMHCLAICDPDYRLSDNLTKHTCSRSYTKSPEHPHHKLC